MSEKRTSFQDPHDPNAPPRTAGRKGSSSDNDKSSSTSHDEKARPVSSAPTTLSEEESAIHPPLIPHFQDDDGPPPLNYTLHTRARHRWIAIFFILLFIEAGVLPLILFYSLQWGAHLSITKNLAIITSLVGTVSGIKVGQRTWLLLLKDGHESRRPIGAGRWGFDFFQYVYRILLLSGGEVANPTFSILINIGLAGFFVPLIIGSSL